jgi:hypothetical protein
MWAGSAAAVYPAGSALIRNAAVPFYARGPLGGKAPESVLLPAMATTRPRLRFIRRSYGEARQGRARRGERRLSAWQLCHSTMTSPPGPGANAPSERESESLSNFTTAKIRLATLDDIPALVELEGFWPSTHLSADSATLRQRLAAYPAGQFVAIAADCSLRGALYTQRAASCAELETTTRDTELALHQPRGPIIQLLGVVQQPGVRVGLALRDHVLELGRNDETAKRVVGITRCRNFRGSSADEYRTHVFESDDPGLLFHTAAGARVRALCPQYRPLDATNLGFGVLVEYDLERNGEGSTT